MAFGSTHYPRPWQWVTSPHQGVDFVVDDTGIVIAIAEGKVLVVGGVGLREVGREILVAHPTIDRWVGYQHLATVDVQIGDVVRRGQVLGTAVRPGHNVGAAVGPSNWIPHVHVEICLADCSVLRLEDPMRYIRACISKAGPTDVVYPVPC